MIHAKLVRDNIPDEIHARGARCTYRLLDQHEFVIALCNKLKEEAAEVDEARYPFRHERMLEELADLQTVLDTLLYTMGFTSLELNAAVNKKMREKGRFTNRVFLEQSWEPNELRHYDIDALAMTATLVIFAAGVITAIAWLCLLFFSSK